MSLQDHSIAYDIVLLTERLYVPIHQPGIDIENYLKKVGSDLEPWYIQNVIEEDGLVMNALQKKGLKVALKSWDDPDFDWSTARFALFRTTWDYFHRFEEFSAWLDRASAQTILINSEELIQWNMHKSYLLELEAKKINIPPTYLVRAGDKRSLYDIHIDWGAVKGGIRTFKSVLKPAFSGAARHTYFIKGIKERKELEPRYRALISNEDMLVQPFMGNVVRLGEISIVMIGDKYSHAVLKKAKKGDFRVQDDFGGTVEAYSPSQKEIDFAIKAVRACPTLPYYARVDIIRDNSGKLAVAELEMIEPELWFRNRPEAADELAEEIVDRLFF